jgi:hypothetical protein
MKNYLVNHKLITASTAVVLAILVTVGLAAFQPWKLWIDESADEAPPVEAAAAGPEGGSSPPAAARVGPKEVFGTRTWNSVEHGTTGRVRIYQKADGSHVLRLEDLDTSNGPDLRLVLSKGAYETQNDLSRGWLDLGRLKGNKGNSNYTIRAGTDLNQYRSVVIWCQRFDAVFAAAPIRG